MVKLLDLAKVIRSKNSGPYELTLDIILKDEASYRLLIEKQCITKEVNCELVSYSSRRCDQCDSLRTRTCDQGYDRKTDVQWRSQ